MFLENPLYDTLLLGGATLGLILLWWLSVRRPGGVPPGPGFALPLLGHLHLVGRDPRAQFTKWRRQYGDIFSLYLGHRLVIVFSGYSVIRDAFVRHADVFSNRPHLLATDKLAENKGILLASGPAWREQRKVAVEILHHLGMGRNTLAEKIQGEVRHYIQAIEDLQGMATDLHKLTVVSVCNNISAIVFGKRYQYDDPLFNKYFEAVEDNFERLGGAAIVNIFPFLEHLPGDLFGIQQILANMKVIREEFLKPHVDRHVSSFKEGHEATDFMYAYLQRMKANDKAGISTTLNENQLATTAGDLVIAGTETTSAAIKWALLLLLHHPSEQEKCYREIRQEIGTSRQPNIHDRPKLVYLEATIQEVLRTVSIGTFAVQHSPSCDILFRGCIIPKDAIILPYMDTVLHDPVTWGDPQNFRPRRFIDSSGKLTHPQQFIPFSVGRRTCPGESLARMELFLYLSSLIQRFRFMPPGSGKAAPIGRHSGSNSFAQTIQDQSSAQAVKM